MPPVMVFQFVLVALASIIGLELLAQHLRLPSAVAMLIGGVALAFVPGVPHVEPEPALILMVFLPPLLMDGAYLIVWEEFKRNVVEILLLAIGAVAFTTLVVGWVTHWIKSDLPWAVCIALGAIVSPPDAIAAKAVLERASLPRSVLVLLEGESMLNDAAGLVLYRFAVVAAMSGQFSALHAVDRFVVLGVGGVVVGMVVGYAIVKILRHVTDTYLVIVVTALAAWTSYIAGEACDVSGVIATVTYGMMLCWHQHEFVSAAARVRGKTFWQVMAFLLQSLVFIMIGLSLRAVIARPGGAEAIGAFIPASVAIVGAAVASRFVWVFGVDGLLYAWQCRVRRTRGAFEWRAALVKSWAGMRGVVTLTAALALPSSMPGRDFLLFASFAVIGVTVLVQGTTIGPLISWMKLEAADELAGRYLTEPQAWARLRAAQYLAVQAHAYDADGNLVHPILLEQYGYRSRVSSEHQDAAEVPVNIRGAHFDIVLAAVAAGRHELLCMHRSGVLHDELLRSLEHDLDLQEIAAVQGKGA